MLTTVFVAALAATRMLPPEETPQGAALGVLNVILREHAIVRRTNVVGRYATVLTSGGTIEGGAVDAPILVERFSFGWQAIDVLNFRCAVDAQDFDQRTRFLLMRGMPEPRDDRPCRWMLRDSGPRADVEAVRRKMWGPLIPAVVVSGRWAMGTRWGGQGLWRKESGVWTGVTGGGGVIGTDVLRKYGVPQSQWCALRVYDARCGDYHGV